MGKYRQVPDFHVGQQPIFMTVFVRQEMGLPEGGCGVVDEVVLNGIEGQLGVFLHVHLFHDPGAVGADGRPVAGNRAVLGMIVL